MSAGILDKVVDLLEWYAPLQPETRPGPTTLLFEGGLDLDSVAVVQLVVELETAFECQIPSEAITAETFRTVGDVVAMVNARMEAKA